MLTQSIQADTKTYTERVQRGSLGLIGAARFVIGAAGVAQPAVLGRMAGIDRVTAENTAWLTQLAAARDLLLGAGQVISLLRGDAAGTLLWARMGMLADVADTCVLTAATARGKIGAAPGGLFAAVALGAVGAGVIATRRSV